MEKLPFDPYDFFGYIASGLLFVVGMNLVLGYPKNLLKYAVAELVLRSLRSGKA
jgi:hypothetical protein